MTAMRMFTKRPRWSAGRNTIERPGAKGESKTVIGSGKEVIRSSQRSARRGITVRNDSVIDGKARH
jgi:hypothetical protein